MDTAAESERDASVLMIVGNDISHDTRVLKSALALADGGLKVTLLGYSSSGEREVTNLGAVRVIRVPVPWTLQKARNARRVRRRTPVAIALTPAERTIHNLRNEVRRRELTINDSATNRILRVFHEAKHQSVRARAELDRRGKPMQESAWKSFDATMHRNPMFSSWRRVLPEIDDYELAMGPVIDLLDWDVIHAHDVHMVGLASRAVARRRASGRAAQWVYDAHEYVAGLSLYGSRTRRRRAAYLDLEREYIHDAASVVTVTEPLAETLVRDHRLAARPDVVMNTPELLEATTDRADLRTTLGLDPDVPLMVYSGGVTSARGIETAVSALPMLPGVHLAVVCVPGPHTKPALSLLTLAQEVGCADRLHLVEPVRPDEVTAFVASADLGLLPLLRFGSHDVALANKLFEYLYAGAPVLVSDCRAQREFVRSHGVGGVHRAGDPASFAEEAAALLERRAELRLAIDAYKDVAKAHAWSVQQATLRAVYRRLLPEQSIVEPVHTTHLDSVTEVAAEAGEGPSVVGIGPANMAGQGWEWAKALERNLPGLRAEVLTVQRDTHLRFRADVTVPATRFARDTHWAQAFELMALSTWSHALIEAGRPIFGVRNGRDFAGDVRVLRAAGVEVGLLFHGSELRDPAASARRTQWSPFGDPSERVTADLQTKHDVLRPLIEAFDGPMAVSTPDLLLDLPGAAWVPVVVDLQRWIPGPAVLVREVPVVVHVPSRASLKGSTSIEAALTPLAASGVIEFRRLEGVSPEDMPKVIAEADIVVDQLSIGIYGVAAAEAMAAERIVVSHVMPQVRDLCPEELPIVEANPDTLADVITGLVRDREQAREIAAQGRAYVERWHDGRRSAEVMAETFGLRGADHDEAHEVKR